MDELVIEGKKYISSKRAADITGYAKDYVGQLCREGYVVARRVGRNWYVLEAAIKDHRFGVDTASNPVPQSPEPQTPRYEPQDADNFPSVHPLRTQPMKVIEPEELVEEDSVAIEDSWQAWFNSFGQNVSDVSHEEELLTTISPEHEGTVSIESDELPAEREEAEVVRIHHVSEISRGPTKEEGVPTYPEQSYARSYEQAQIRVVAARPRHRLAWFLAKALLLLVALSSLVAAMLGTGYFDGNITSVGRAALISGIIYYTK